VTIVEFTDYQCPYCHRAQTVIDDVLSRYPGKVRLVHLDFPLDGHPGATPAARAARCAGEQGKFWEYHRSLMTAPGALDDADLKSRAASLHLSASSFGRCLSSDRHDAAIQASLEEGESLGVTGTPAYFVNGRMLSGARPLEDFTQLIDAELAGRS
jgi:protein-disulfide isomerase